MPLQTWLRPLWEGETIAEESAWVMENGQVNLLCEPLEILRIESADGCVYRPGEDYVLGNGHIELPPGSTIPQTHPHELHWPERRNANDQPAVQGGFWLCDPATIRKLQIRITYRHAGWTGPVPAKKGELLPRTRKSIEEGRSVYTLFYGDSITEGLDATGHSGAAPNMPIWTDLASHELLEPVNTAIAGISTPFALRHAGARAANIRPELAVLAFGMNDGTGMQLPTRQFIANIRAMMELIRAKKPECEFVLVAGILPNTQISWCAQPLVSDYAQALMDLEEPGVAVMDMGAVHEYLLTRKTYQDLSGNNVNHPNDFLARVYAHMLRRTLES